MHISVHVCLPLQITTMATRDNFLMSHGVSKDKLKCPVSKEHRNRIAKDISEQWETLATYIDIPGVEVSDIKEQYSRPVDRRMAMMRRWHQLHGPKATYIKLINGLMEVGRNDLIEMLLDRYKRQSSMLRDGSSSVQPQEHRLNDDTNSSGGMLCLSIVFFIVISMFLFNNLLNEQPTINNTDSSMHTSTDHDCSVMFSIMSQSFNDSQTNCNHSESDLPDSGLPSILYNDIFVGRENDMCAVINKIMIANIVNINGAPGFGKSALAIHVGHQILKNGISVRYINVADKFTSMSFDMSSETSLDDINGKIDKKQELVNQMKFLSLRSSALSSPSSSSSPMNDMKKFPRLVDELLIWSEAVQCTAVLILDNCDDVLTSSSRDIFIRMIKLLVDKSKHNLHIIVVSREKLFFKDWFDSWTVRELNQKASVDLLDQIAPAIGTDHLTDIAELVDGCPLALKVVGQLLHIHGESITHEIRTQMIKVLDKPSDKMERFRVIMDMAFARLEEQRECGYIFSLFPGSFGKDAGNAVAVIEDKDRSEKTCLELYTQHSLVDDFSLAYHQRFKMHRLIQEYLKYTVNAHELYQDAFKARFRTYFVRFLLICANSIEEELDSVQIHRLSLEAHNIDYLITMLLGYPHLTAEELAVLAFLVDQGQLQMTKLREYYKLYIANISGICNLLNPTSCSNLYSHIVKELYEECKCETLTEYVQNFIVSPCTEYFKCTTIQYLMDTRNFEFTDTIKVFIQNVAYYNCNYVIHHQDQVIILPSIITIFATMISLFHYKRIDFRLIIVIASCIILISLMYYTYCKKEKPIKFPSLEPKSTKISSKALCYITVLFFVPLLIGEIILIIFKELRTPLIIILILTTVYVIDITVTVRPESYFCSFIPLCQ